MFNHILVTQDILPIRHAASQGDLDALFALLKHVLEGKEAQRCSGLAFNLISAMFNHPDFKQNLPRAWHAYFLCSEAEKLLYEEGKSSYSHYLENACDYLKSVIEIMTVTPCQMWNFELLDYCIDWIKEHEPLLREELAHS